MQSDRQSFGQSWHTHGRSRPHILIAGRRGNWVSDEAVPGAEFGQLLRRYRRASGWSQEELAEHAAVGVRTICDLECGRTIRPYRRTLGSLATALGLRGLQLDEFVRLSRRGPGTVPMQTAVPDRRRQPGSRARRSRPGSCPPR